MGDSPWKASRLPLLESSISGCFGYSVWRCELEGEWLLRGYPRLDHSDVSERTVQYAFGDAVQTLISFSETGCLDFLTRRCPNGISWNCPVPSLGFGVADGRLPPISCSGHPPHLGHPCGSNLAQCRLLDRNSDVLRSRSFFQRNVAGRERDRSVALGCPPARFMDLCDQPARKIPYLFSKPWLRTSSWVCMGSPASVSSLGSFRVLGDVSVGRERDRSVARGCPPIGSLPQTLAWLIPVGEHLAAFFVTLQLLLILALWRLLIRAAPGNASPLARGLCIPAAANTDGLALSFRSLQASHGRDSGRISWPAKKRALPICGKRAAREKLLAHFAAWLGFCSFPVQVWAAPKGLAEAVSHVADLVAVAPGETEAPRLNEDIHPEPFSWRQAVAQVQAESLAEAYGSEATAHPAGIDANPQLQAQPQTQVALTSQDALVPSDKWEHPGLPLPGPSREVPLSRPVGESGLDAAEVETTGPGVVLDVPVILAAAGYRIAHTTAGVLFPSHVGALEGQVRAASADLLCECGEQLTPVYPQVAPGFATFVASPTWFAEAKLVVAFLDARAVRGHAFAVVLSFPTTVQEINRVAGLSSVAAHDIFVSGQPLPLDEHLEIALPTGSLIRMLPPGSKPLWAAPLAFALWHPHYWPSGIVLPRTRESACALVLHSSGKYLYDRFSSDDWANQNGIASLVGVSLAEVRMHAADPAEMLPYVYRGAPVRGVIAVVERRPGRDNQGRQLPYVVFLDSRPLGFDLNFVVCEQLSLSIDWLLQYLQQPPPAGWRLVVKGGQRQQDRVDFFPGEVLILGFQRCAEDAEEQPESETGFSSDPEQDADSDSGDGHRSDSSTRSRSRGHTSEPHSKSEDRSYQGLYTPPDANAHFLHLHRETLLLAKLGPLSSLAAVASSGALQVQVSTVKCCLRLLQSLKPSVPCVNCRVPEFGGQEFVFPRHDDTTGRTLPALRDIGDRSPRRPGAPDFRATPQALVPEVPLPTARALFAVLIEGCRPEFVPLTLPVPCDIALAMSELQIYRLPGIKRFFPKLVPVPFQPAPGFAIFLAAPRWPKAEVEVLLDCRSFSGQLHAAFLPPVVNAAILCSKAGIAWWRNAAVSIEPYVTPVQGAAAIRLYPGSVVVFLESESPPPLLGDLTTMLRSAECWDHLAPMPFLFDPALWILSDEGAFRFAIEGARPRRFVLAHVLEYDPSRLVAVAPEPPIRDFCDQGATTDAVLVVSQRVPTDRAWGSWACVVVIDQRPLLRGVTWTFVHNGLFSICCRAPKELPTWVPACLYGCSTCRGH